MVTWVAEDGSASEAMLCHLVLVSVAQSAEAKLDPKSPSMQQDLSR